MISKRISIVIAVIILIVFSTITIETINNSSTSLTTAPPSDKSQVILYSPVNGTSFPVFIQNSSLSFNISITSASSQVYLYDISPPNSSSLPKVNGIQLLSLTNLTHLNSTRFPYNYEIFHVTPGKNSTENITLFLNPSQFQLMKVSIPQKGEVYPYVIEIIAETSNGAAVIEFTLLRVQ